ncbi:MAG: hypothetical protein A2W22_06965 [Candidatus Levybacteria bacterium RBG_16_35_11]|nr:MAG: hypothetical protein A2W22_06965 [Candidatus Levybacteria bacterium RBG_16_35_11]
MSNTLSLYNIEAEKSVLGAVLIEPDALLTASDIIEPGDFYREGHKLIYSACLDLYQLGEPIDLITLIERLKAKGELERIGGASYISQLSDNIPTSANISTHAKIVRNKSTQRRISNWANLIKSEAEEAEDLTSFFSKMERDIVELSQYQSINDRDPHVSDIVSNLKRRWNEEKQGLRTYIPVNSKLSVAIPRYVPGHVWAVGGYTSVGKSTFIAQQIVDTCEEGARCMVFSLEDSREEKLIKLIANSANMSQKHLMLGHTNGFEDVIAGAVNKINKWKLYIYDDVYTIDEIRLKVKKGKLQSGLDIIFVDYIQNIIGDGTLYEKLSEAVVKLQKMAKELQVVVVFVSQVSNEAMRSHSELIGLKGAGELSAAPDIVLWLKRVKGEDKERFLDCEIRKNRPFGLTGIYPLRFSEHWSRIEKRGIL